VLIPDFHAVSGVSARCFFALGVRVRVGGRVTGPLGCRRCTAIVKPSAETRAPSPVAKIERGQVSLPSFLPPPSPNTGKDKRAGSAGAATAMAVLRIRDLHCSPAGEP